MTSNILQLTRLAAEFDGESVEAIALTGSVARGQATPFSDVDLLRFTVEPPENSHERYALYQREGFLVSVSTATIDEKRRELAAPQTAIWAVPGLRQARILVDKRGALAALKREADAFVWQPLQAAADVYASRQLAGYAEEVHKLLGALARNDESAMVYAAMGLVLGLSNALAVQQGLLLESENEYFRRVLDAADALAGPACAWSRALRLAAGFDPLPAGQPPPVQRGKAALQLYVESVNLLEKIIRAEDAPVIRRAVELSGKG